MVPSFFLPLDKQFDDGLGTVARAFHDGAKQLSEAFGKSPVFQRSLPVCYLYRHAVELFLKSLLLIVWRKFSGLTDPLPSVLTAQGKAKTIDKEHSVSALFDRLQAMCNEYALRMVQVDPQLGKWLPPGLAEAIAAIDSVDRASDFFRYPVSRSKGRDAEKSSMKPESIESLQERSRSTPSEVFALVMVDQDKSPVAAYTHQEGDIDAVREQLVKCADHLSGIHAWFDAVLVAGLND